MHGIGHKPGWACKWRSRLRSCELHSDGNFILDRPIGIFVIGTFIEESSLFGFRITDLATEGLMTVVAGIMSFWLIQDFPDTARVSVCGRCSPSVPMLIVPHG